MPWETRKTKGWAVGRNGRAGGSRAAGGEEELCTEREDGEEEDHASLRREAGEIE